MTKYIFRAIQKPEIPQFFSLIIERIAWMDKNHIQQWNSTHYTDVFPLSYFEKRYKQNCIFVLENTATCQISAAAILLEQDEQWKDQQPALYIHHLVSKVDEQGAGALLLYEIEKYALKLGKRYLRLDSIQNNDKLTQYYENLGYAACGYCQDGPYQGILRQKEISED